VYEGADGTVFENRDALPRVFSPNRVSLIASRAERPSWIRNAFAEFGAPASAIAGKRDWRDHAFVLGRETKDVTNGSVEIAGYQESTNGASFRARVSAAGSGAFLVTSLVQDGGWSARDEAGRVIGTTLANGPFLTLQVPGGDHAIFLSYWPPGFRTGIGILVLTLIVTVTVWARAATARSRRRSPSTPEDAEISSYRAERMSRIWLAGASVVMLAGLALSRVPLRSTGRIPATPLDFTSYRLAHLWTFLNEVHGKVPEGATYTVLAPNPDDEMYLYMFSLGLLDKQQALPSSYFGVPRPNGREARYVLSYGNALPETGQVRLVFRAAEGAVYERVARR